MLVESQLSSEHVFHCLSLVVDCALSDEFLRKRVNVSLITLNELLQFILRLFPLLVSGSSHYFNKLGLRYLYLQLR